MVTSHQPEVPAAVASQTGRIDIPFLFNTAFNGLEPSLNLVATHGEILVSDYRIIGNIGQGSFSTVYRAASTQNQDKPVSIKVLRNNKDCFDTGLGEIRIYSFMRREDPEGRRHIVCMLDCFYTREHLFIVTELLNNSLFAHYMHLETLGGNARAEYYNAATVGALAAQMLDALDFCAGHGIAHCDVKTPNICIANTEARKFKLIDFGSAVLRCDVHMSYLQSRWYRAPEVILGCPWDAKVDIWSLGCVLAEVLLGYCLFQFPTCELVLAAQKAARGAFPRHMLEAHPIAQMFFSESGCVYEVDPRGMAAGVYLLRSSPNAPLSSMLSARINPALFGEAPPGVTSFLEALLTIDPDERLSAADAIQHEWMAAFRLPPPPATAAPTTGTD